MGDMSALIAMMTAFSNGNRPFPNHSQKYQTRQDNTNQANKPFRLREIRSRRFMKLVRRTERPPGEITTPHHHHQGRRKIDMKQLEPVGLVSDNKIQDADAQ